MTGWLIPKRCSIPNKPYNKQQDANFLKTKNIGPLAVRLSFYAHLLQKSAPPATSSPLAMRQLLNLAHIH